MNMKQLAIPAMTALLTVFALGVTAAPKGDDSPGNSGQRHETGSDNGNANSNRQSDPGSTRGQARAEERHEMKKDKHPKSKERRWYNFYSWDKDGDGIRDEDEKAWRWWWPFS